MTQLGGERVLFTPKRCLQPSAVISRCVQSINPESSRTKPLFRRREGSCGEFPAVVAIRARSLGPLEETRAVEMTPRGWGASALHTQEMSSGSGVISRCRQSINPASSRTKPFFRRSEGSRAEFPAVVVIRARSLASLEKTRAVGMTQLGGERVLFTPKRCLQPSGVISRCVQSTNPESSRTKPPFRRREGSRGEFPAVVAIRARSPSASLRAGSRPAGENAGRRDDAAGWGAGGVRHARYASGRLCCYTMHAINKSGVIPNEAAFQAERGISRGVPGCGGAPREISRPAGENAGLRDDAAGVGRGASGWRRGGVPLDQFPADFWPS